VRQRLNRPARHRPRLLRLRPRRHGRQPARPSKADRKQKKGSRRKSPDKGKSAASSRPPRAPGVTSAAARKGWPHGVGITSGTRLIRFGSNFG
jgi:hypothetical protein